MSSSPFAQYNTELEIASEQDLSELIAHLKEIASRIQFGIIDQTKITTAASELVRNMLRYAGSGQVSIKILSNLQKGYGISITFKDQGPGIRDVQKAMTEGYSTGKTLGIGLPGTKRIVDEFDLQTEAGKGTQITIVKWSLP